MLGKQRKSAFSVFVETKPEIKVENEEPTFKRPGPPQYNNASNKNPYSTLVNNNNKKLKVNQQVQSAKSGGASSKMNAAKPTPVASHPIGGGGGVQKHKNASGKMSKKERRKFARLTNENLAQSLFLCANGQLKQHLLHHTSIQQHQQQTQIDFTGSNNKYNTTAIINNNKNNNNSRKVVLARAENGQSSQVTKGQQQQQQQQKLRLNNSNKNSNKNGKREQKKNNKNTLLVAPLSVNIKGEGDSDAVKTAGGDDDVNGPDDIISAEMFDSRLEGIKVLKHIIEPVKTKEFFSEYWEKKPLLIKRSVPSHYKNWFSCKELDKILKTNHLEFTQNIDVTTYINEVKEKHNPEGRAYGPLVWDFFQQGCSIRLLNPATYSRNIWNYLSLLQELFGTCVGSNIYLTPSGTQGFAPHYDDIEAFVMQLEGKKRWRVYKPLSKEETLPRFSSKNYAQADICDPIIDVILEAGDLLYFPRGYIHQANACDDAHSLHITVSAYQKNTWGDFLAKLMPGAVELAMQQDIEYRRGLPINFLLNNGIVFEDESEKKSKKEKDREDFIKKTGTLLKNLIKYAPIDDAVDQMAKNFIHQSLPPCLTEVEKLHSIHGHGERWNEKKMRVENICEIEPDTSIRIIRRNCLRFVAEEGKCMLFHNLDNTTIFCEKEPQFLEVEDDAALAIEFLIRAYPHYVTVDELPMSTIEEKIGVASCLYDKGLLVTGEPLDNEHEDNDEDDEDENEDDDNDSDDDDENEEDESRSDENEENNGTGGVNVTHVGENNDSNMNEDDEDNDEEGEKANSDGFNSEDYDCFNSKGKKSQNAKKKDDEYNDDSDNSDDDDDDDDDDGEETDDDDDDDENDI